MNDEILLRIDGEVEHPVEMTFLNLAAIDPSQQIDNVNQIDPARTGGAIRLSGLLELVRPTPSAKYLGLHSSTDDFHASIPLEPIRDRALLIYRVNDRPLNQQAGGPLRFFIPDHAACHADEIDECANVKFIDHIELTAAKGFDNRPQDEDAHARLHREQGGHS